MIASTKHERKHHFVKLFNQIMGRECLKRNEIFRRNNQLNLNIYIDIVITVPYLYTSNLTLSFFAITTHYQGGKEPKLFFSPPLNHQRRFFLFFFSGIPN